MPVNKQAARQAASMHSSSAKKAGGAAPSKHERPRGKAGSNPMKLDEENNRNKKRKDLNGGIKEKVGEYFKIDSLPKDVTQSIPFRGITNEGIIETKEGTYTKCYHLQDTNFQLATDEEQALIFSNYMDFLNSFDVNTKWEVTIFNHKIDKKQTMHDLRILPQKDGLNKYRNEMNKIILGSLKRGNNSIISDKYLTVAIDDKSDVHAETVLSRLDGEIETRIKKISGKKTAPMTTEERLKLLYDIYNQDGDYRFYKGMFNNEINLQAVADHGKSVKDLIGPGEGMQFFSNYFKLNETYGTVFYLQNLNSETFNTNFIADLADISATMLISTYYEPMETSKAIKLVRAYNASVDAEDIKIKRQNAHDGIYLDTSDALLKKKAEGSNLMADITTRSQKTFFVTVTVAVFADSREELDENISLVKSVASDHQAPLRILDFQQEFGLRNALPLVRNDLKADMLLTTESAAVFIPYSQEVLMQKNAIFYGLSGSTKNMVLYDRLSGNNFNGLIFGASGSGKSFTAKCEMINVILNHPDAQVFVIDPQGEYYPLADSLHGTRVLLAPGSNEYINPLDMDLADDEVDPVTQKSDFITTMIEIMLGHDRTLDPIARSVIDRCVRKIYEPYIRYIRGRDDDVTFDKERCPQLLDLAYELRRQEEPEAQNMANVLEMYTSGSFNTFSRRTTVNPDDRFVVYDIKSLGSGMKELGLHVCIQDIYNKMLANSKRHVYTWMYIDEFHILLQEAGTRKFLKQIWKMARKWLGVPTGIMQNTEDLARNDDGRAIFNNTNFIIMLKSSLQDRLNLAELLNLSAAQIENIDDGAEKGHGLMYTGTVTIPFGFDFPKNTELYKIMTTSQDVKGTKFS